MADQDENIRLTFVTDTAGVTRATAETTKLGATVDATGRKMAGLTQSVQASGRALQDFTAGWKSGGLAGALNAVSNNTEQLGSSLAKAAGLGAAAGTAIGGGFQLVAVGVQLALPHIARFSEAIGLTGKAVDVFKTEVSTLTDRIKVLTEKPVKLAVELDELDVATEKLRTLSEAKAAFDQLMGTRSAADQAAGKLFGQGLVDAPGGMKPVVDKVMKDQMMVEFRKDPDNTLRQEEIDRQKALLQVPGLRDKKLTGVIGGAGMQTEGDVIEKKIRDLEAVQDEVLKRAESRAKQGIEANFGGAAKGDPKALAKAGEMMAAAGIDEATQKKTIDAVLLGEEEVHKRRLADIKEIDRANAIEEESIKKAGEAAQEAAEKEKKAGRDALEESKRLNKEELDDYAKKEEAKRKLRKEAYDESADLLKKQVTENAARSNAGMARTANASGLYGAVDEMMFRAQEQAQNDPKFQRQFRPKTRRWADMSAEERKELTKQGRAGRNQMIAPTLEEGEQMVAGRNAEDDQKIKDKLARQLLRNRVTRDPAHAAGMANMMVNQERKAMDAANGDQPLDRNNKLTEELNGTLKELLRKGIAATATAG